MKIRTIATTSCIAALIISFSVPVASADHLGRVGFCPGQFWLPAGPLSSAGTCVPTCPNGIADDFPRHCALPPVEPPTASVFGVKWNDLDADGQLEPGEPGLADWQIDLSCSSGGSTSALTNVSGEYEFLEIPTPNSCTVAEVAQPGWTATTPATVQLSLSPGAAVTVNFGNATPSGLIEGLIQQVENLVAIGTLDDGIGNALITKLTGAKADLEKDNMNAACGKMGAFINHVEALVGSSQLSAVDGQVLIDAATVIRESIGC